MKHYFPSRETHDKSDIFSVLAVGVVGMSYGSLAMAYGFPLWVPFVLLYFLYWRARPNLCLSALLPADGNPLAAAAAGIS